MRHVMALRVSKAVLVFAIALFYTILVLNNITAYGSNHEFVCHVLMMDSTRNLPASANQRGHHYNQALGQLRKLTQYLELT